MDHRNHELRAALALAVHLSREWTRELFVVFGGRAGEYRIVSKRPKGLKPQLAYAVHPDGTVTPGRTYPTFGQLFGLKGEMLCLEFRMKGEPDWNRLTDETFLPCHRHLAEARVSQLTATNTNFEYRVGE